jgi:hypothetical protein
MHRQQQFADLVARESILADLFNCHLQLGIGYGSSIDSTNFLGL